MASRILTNSGDEIEKTLSTGYLALVVRGIGLVRDTGVQNISGIKVFYDAASFLSGLNIAGNTAISGNILGSLRPNSDNLYDLGNSTGEWRDLWIDGTGRIDNLHVDENAFITGNLSVLGNAAISGDFTVNNIASHFLPKTDNLYNIGSSSQEFNDLWVDGIGRIDNLHVDENAFFTGNLSVQGSATITGTTTLAGDFVPTNVAAHYLPKTDNLYDLGSSTQEFRNLWIDGTGRIDSLHVDENASISGSISGSSINSSGSLTVGTLFVTGSGIPATRTSAGTRGQFVWGSGHLYVCTGTNLWGRIALTGWN